MTFVGGPPSCGDGIVSILSRPFLRYMSLLFTYDATTLVCFCSMLI